MSTKRSERAPLKAESIDCRRAEVEEEKRTDCRGTEVYDDEERVSASLSRRNGDRLQSRG
jgi:hypothetical protein